MKECVIPLSPNWFLSAVSSGNSAGLYAFGARQEVFVYDSSNADPETLPQLVGLYSEHRELVSAVCLSPDSEQFLCCSADDQNVKLWDVRSLITVQCHSEHTEQITCITWSPKNTDIILTASEKGNIVLWRLKDNTVSSFQLERDYIFCIEASPHDANKIAVGYKKGMSAIADIGKGYPQILQRFAGHDGVITSLCWCSRPGENFLKDEDDAKGALVAIAGRNSIKVWSSLTGKQIFSRELQRSLPSEVPDFMSKKTWIDIHWSIDRPDCIVFTSSTGDVNLWNLRLKLSQKPQQFLCKKMATHNKKIFNIVSVGNGRLASFSLDRQICFWDLESLKAVSSMPTFGGHVYCLRASPLDPGFVAIGSGANTIMVWNQGSKHSVGDVTTLNYGNRSKITCVAWHPEKEGLLAFGSEDGRVGVCNVLTKRPPILSNTFHKKTVYVVCWAYALKNDKADDRMTVYSIGDGNLLQHFILNEEHRKDALNVVECLKEVNGDQIDQVSKSEVSWSHDFTKFAVGSGSGVVEIFNFPDLRITGSIQCHTKLVNCVRWHPQATAEASHTSEYRHWVALAGNDQFISIHDLSTLDGSVAHTKDTVLSQPLRILNGHKRRVTDMCWSLHQDAHLVSVSFDCTAIVWNVKSAEALVCYREHNERVLTCLWSSLDPNLIMTAGSDSVLRVWKLSDQEKADLSLGEKKPKRKKVPSNPLQATPQASGGLESRQETDIDEDEMKELRELLELKKRQLLMHAGSLEEKEGDRNGNGLPAQNNITGIRQNPTSSATERQQQRPPHSSVTCPNDYDNHHYQHHHQATANRNGSANTPSDTTSTVDTATALSRQIQRETKTDGRNNNITGSSSSSSSAARSFANHVHTEVDGEDDNYDNNDDHDYDDKVTGTGTGTDDNVVIGYDDVTVNQLLITADDLVPPVKPLAVLPNYHQPQPLKSSSFSSSSSQIRPKTKSVVGGASNVDFQSGGGGRKRKPKTRSFFPVLSKEANKGKSCLQEDLLDLTTVIAGEGDSSEVIDKKPHLGLYTDRLGTHRCLLQESESHLGHENMEYHLQVELWRGNVAGALQIARQRNELSDWIVAMAPLASHELWEVVCVEYAEQLEEEGHYHKAASYLLAGHRTHQAIELFRNHRLFKEAVSLARIRLSPVDPILEDLYTEWGQNLMKEGQFEQAAKCYLAMRQIQEASKVLARRNDQSSLRTACHMNLLAKDEQTGMEYAFKLFSQYLIAGEWKEAYGFVKEHKSLKPFLSLLSTHELLVEQLSSLCPGLALTQKPLASTSFGQWGAAEEAGKNRINLPDFLVNKLETDPVIPWTPLLISGHSFPHHILRHWYYRLNMDIVTDQLKSTFGVISQLLELQKSFADIPQSMVVLSTHLTLCFISLLLCETSTAITHLLQAVSFIHQHELRGNLLSHFCQLVLPQGPKYLLKLQQEFNASKLVISMESLGGNAEQAGGEGHSTIKKYLSDIKDNDRGISSAGSRCRELDCLRSFYYLAVLEYLNAEFTRVVQHGEDDGVPPCKDEALKTVMTTAVSMDPTNKGTGAVVVDCDGVQNSSSSLKNSSSPAMSSSSSPSSSSSSTVVPSVDSNMTLVNSSSFSSPVDPLVDDINFNSSLVNASTKACSPNSLTNKETVPSFNTQSNAFQKMKTNEMESKIVSPSKSPYSLKSPLISSPTSPSSSSSSSSLSSSMSRGEKSKSYSSSSSSSSSTNQKGKLDQKKLLHISKGILWDAQAKREALTETLGYIHRAISQHLLTNRNESTSSSSSSNTAQAAVSPDLNGANPTSADEDGGCDPSRLLLPSTPSSSSIQASSSQPTSSSSSNPLPSLLSSANTNNLTPPQPPGSINGNTTTTSSTNTTIPPSFSQSRPISQDFTLKTGTTDTNNVNKTINDSSTKGKRTPPALNRSVSETVSSRKVSDNPSVPLDVFEVRQKVEQELLGIVPTSPSMTSHKSTKVFWRDSKENSPGYIDDALVKRNPEGTHIPLEWDDLPVDQKFTKPYISQALLKQEQETIAAELKQVPDASKVPFPSIQRCTKTLLNACVISIDLSLEEKQAYMKQLKDWSTLFAVTSYSKERVERDFLAAIQQHRQQ